MIFWQSKHPLNASNDPPPNIVYLLVDDLGYGDVDLENDELNVFKNPHIETPHLAKLARQSLVFTNHYAASPVCSPSRAGLLTGRAPTRANINLYINDLKDNNTHFLHGSEITIPELLKTKGYQTAIFGKWHLNGANWEDPQAWTSWTGSFPKQQGFEHGMVTKEDPHFTRKLHVNTQKHPGDFFTVEGKPVGPIKGYSSDIITDHAIDWLNAQKRTDDPFFLYLSYDAVHIRIAAADQYTNMYNTGNARRDEYYANVTHLDDAIGRFVRHLDDMGLAENTIVFFSSDNGPDVWKQWDATYFCHGTSYPLMGQKYQLWEGGVRVPGMVRWVGQINPGISHEPNSTLDVLPTVCELAGITMPQDREFDGISILDHITESKTIKRNKPLYWQFDYPRSYQKTNGEGYERKIVGTSMYNKHFQPRVSIRSGDYVLMGLSDEPYSKPTRFELYDITQDVEQENDISKSNPEIAEKLRKRMLEMYDEVNNDRLKMERIISKGSDNQ